MWIEKKSNIKEQKFKVYINCTSFKKEKEEVSRVLLNWIWQTKITLCNISKDK